MKTTIGETRTTCWVNKTLISVKLGESWAHQCNNPPRVIREREKSETGVDKDGRQT